MNRSTLIKAENEVNVYRRYGASIGETRKDRALQEVKIHNAWFSKHIMQDYNPNIRTIMVLPRFDNRYRDEYLPYVDLQSTPFLYLTAIRSPEERDYSGFDSNFHASLAGLPNILVPSRFPTNNTSLEL